MYGDTAHLPVNRLALPGVQACSDLDAQRAHPFEGRLGAPDRSCRTVESGQEAVPGRVDLGAAVPGEQRTDDRVMLLQYVAPSLSPEFGGHLSGCDDIGEENSGEHALE